MPEQKSWNNVSHEERIRLLKDKSEEELIQEYCPPEMTEVDFREKLLQDQSYWKPQNLKHVVYVDQVPTKDTTIGARRDLNRAEAILELIDNSIDVWLRRRKSYRRHTAPTLQIYIDRDDATNVLTFEDNAGGIEPAKLVNLVIPGYSDTASSEHTIGSYRTGGKKAVFKLASDAIIRTRYWNPVGTTDDDAVEIHLDKEWLDAPNTYKFPYYVLNDKSVLAKGQTIYAFRLRDDASVWDPDENERIRLEIQRTYTLLLLRHPEIEIYFLNREEPIGPLEDLYKFTGAKASGMDLLPQRAFFKFKMQHEGVPQDVVIEIVLGCRTTSATRKGNDIWGIDLYGNDRLFVLHDQNNFIEWFNLPKGNSRQFVRGFINIHGPNSLVPWDTHKRHLNVDLPIVGILRKNKLIKDFFEAWREAYNELAVSEAIKKIISVSLSPWKSGSDLNIPHSTDVALNPDRKRGQMLPDGFHKPKVPVAHASQKPIEIKFAVTAREFRRLAGDFDVEGEPDSRNVRIELGEAIREYLLKKG